jgi:3-methyladenine DNA glycosylase AlkD
MSLIMATDLAKALTFIRHHQDGEIAEKIRNSGLNYNMNYGVSSLLLVNFANKIGRNQELAEQLWKENFREAKLLSFMVADLEQISDEKIEEYLAGCNNNEMVEIAVMNLFSRRSNALQLAKEWIRRSSNFEKMAGYLTIARLTMQQRFGDENDLRDILISFEEDVCTTDYFVFQAIEKAFQELAFRRKDLKDAIIEKTKYICANNKEEKFVFQLQELVQTLEYC